MHRRIILVGDVTDHGGVVLAGGAAWYDGKPIARVGDTVSVLRTATMRSWAAKAPFHWMAT